MGKILFKVLADQKRSLMFWSLGLILTNVLLLAFYPSIRDTAADFSSYLDKMPQFLRALFVGEISDFASPVGYLNSQLFLFMAPLLLMVFTVAAGSGAIAGEEEKGTLDVLLANPVSRWQVLLEKFIAMVLTSVLLSVVFTISLIIGAKVVDLNIETQRLLDIMISLELLSLSFGSFALALGSATGSRGISIGLSAALGVASYLINGLAPAVESLKGYQKFSPFYHYIGENPLTDGLKIDHVGVLVGLIVVFLIVALLAFERRDLKI